MLEKIRTEVVRKLIHLLIALSVPLAAFNRVLTVALLAGGTLVYVVFELLRFNGMEIPVISPLTAIAMRNRDRGRFVLGPVTLGLGALLSLFLFPFPAAAAAIYALAFGDGLSSLAGRLWGRFRPRFLFGKSVEGSCVCFAAVLVSTYLVTGGIRPALIGALAAMLVEALPLGDYDNLAIPLTTGLAVTLVLHYAV
ncbi:MAG: phosphatidate cytidylyltransferase [Spirochaetaceae bacterium]|jgi:dolichol kinase|nr:phosphatidate cytidylyltransferase [Spirochaetaceae bacterium]